MEEDCSQGQGISQEENQGMHLVLVQAPHGVGQSQGGRLFPWSRVHHPEKQLTQSSCDPGCLGNCHQLWLAGSHGQHGLQHGQQLTHQTPKETMDNVLVSFHDRVKFEHWTASPVLPHAPLPSNSPTLALHSIGGSCPWPHSTIWVEPRLPHGPPISFEVLQEKYDG